MKRLLFVLLFAVSVGPTPAAAQSADALFQQALTLERAQGDLKGAIALYERIVREYPGSRTVAARSLMQLGKAYERAGRDDARAAYERLVRDYSDQGDAAGEARTRLAALTPAVAQSSERPTISLLWERASESYYHYGYPSPDGRFVAQLEDGYSISVYELATGSTRQVLPPSARKDATEWFDGLVWSHDGGSIAYVLQVCQPPCGSPESWDLRILDTTTGAVRVLAPDSSALYLHDWSPDGRYIVGTYSGRIAQIDTRSGMRTDLGGGDPATEDPIQVRYSPDGRYLAYARRALGREDFDIRIMAVDGSGDWAAVDHPATDTSPHWSLDGAKLLFGSDRSGARALWVQPLRDGRPVGDATYLREYPDNQTSMLGFDRDGRFRYSTAHGFASVYSADVDWTQGRMTADPVKLSGRVEGFNVQPAWSPDGSQLAWSRLWSPHNDEVFLVIRDMATGEERDLVPHPRKEGQTSPYNESYIWSADGKSMYASVFVWPGRINFERIDLRTGSPELLDVPITRSEPAFLDSNRLVYARADSLFIRDLAAGDDRLLFHGDGGSVLRPTPSADGSRIAFFLAPARGTGRTTLRVLDVMTGHSRPVAEAIDGFHFQIAAGLNWITDSHELLVGLTSDEVPLELAGVAVDTGVTRVMHQFAWPAEGGDVLLEPHQFRIHPNGTTTAFVVQQFRTEIWAIDHLLRD